MRQSPKIAIAATVLAAALVAAWPASVGHATAPTAKKRSASELRAPMIRQMIVKLRNPKAVELTQPLGAERVAALSARAGVGMKAFRPMSGNASVLRLERPITLAEANAVAARLAQDPNVEYASPDLPVRVYQTLPQDLGYTTRLWHYYPPAQTFSADGKTVLAVGGANLRNAWNLPGASNTLRGSRKVVVALIDTGVALNHPELSGTLLQGYDFISSDVFANNGVPANFVANDGDGRDADPSDPGDWVTSQEISAYPNACNPPASDSSWHGTHMAGTIAGVWNNGVGNPPPPGTSTAGIAPNVRILPLRALGKCGGAASDVIDAMRFAAGIPVTNPGGATIVNLTPAKIINLSLGGQGGVCNHAYQAAVDDVVSAGALVVAAAGNDGLDGISQPANCRGVLAVAGHAINGDNADYSNVGPEVGISAPGGGMPQQLGTTITSSDTGYYTWSSMLFGAFGPDSVGAPPNQDKTGPAIGGFTGTSSATAHASAVAALVKSVMRTASPAQVRNFIVGTARPHPAGGFCATGQPGAGLCGAGLLDASAAVAAAAVDAPPLADAGPDRTVAPGAAVTLDARASIAFNGRQITSYAWRQIDNGATRVALSGPSSPLAGFTAPAASQTLVFELTVTDDSTPTPKSDSIDVAITVQAPLPPPSGGGGTLPLWQLLLLAAFGLAARIRRGA